MQTIDPTTGNCTHCAQRMLDTAEVARQLNISERQVSRLRQAEKLKCVRISGSAVRHTQAQVDAFIAERSNDA